jgi:hypothetical protein
MSKGRQEGETYYEVRAYRASNTHSGDGWAFFATPDKWRSEALRFAASLLPIGDAPRVVVVMDRDANKEIARFAI